MRVTYDPEADAAYVYLTDRDLQPGRDTVPCSDPDGATGDVFADWKDGKLVGSEVLDAKRLLPNDLLAGAG
ncbi:MAG: DUF2283 domain-containing protein [Chloroflexi bacterium]|nr:DUF2283 domain-containing protein [Chloroflexota bacterium]